MPVAGPLLANSEKNHPVARRRVPSLQSNLVSDKSSVKAPISKQGGTAGKLAAAYVPKLLAETSSRRKAFC